MKREKELLWWNTRYWNDISLDKLSWGMAQIISCTWHNEWKELNDWTGISKILWWNHPTQHWLLHVRKCEIEQLASHHTQFSGRIGGGGEKKLAFPPNLCCHKSKQKLIKNSKGCNGKYSSLVSCTKCKPKKHFWALNSYHTCECICIYKPYRLGRIQKLV